MNLRVLNMEVNQFEVWLANLNPPKGTESGKVRPVLVVQTDLLNKVPHLSTIICPITTNILPYSEILRVHLKKGMANVEKDCDILIDQLRAIDNKRLVDRIGVLPNEISALVRENLQIVLDLSKT